MTSQQRPQGHPVGVAHTRGDLIDALVTGLQQMAIEPLEVLGPKLPA